MNSRSISNGCDYHSFSKKPIAQTLQLNRLVNVDLDQDGAIVGIETFLDEIQVPSNGKFDMITSKRPQDA